MHDPTRLPAGLPVPDDDGAADHLTGQTVPHLVLPSTSDGSVALDALGSGRTILYIYPLTGRPELGPPDDWDTIPGARGCTTEACDFRDHYRELLAAGPSAVYGLSSQDSDYQRELVVRLGLPFEMLSDRDLTLAKELTLPTFAAGGTQLFKRLTLVIRDSVVEHAFYPIFPPNQHAQEVLRWLRVQPAASA